MEKSTCTINRLNNQPNPTSNIRRRPQTQKKSHKRGETQMQEDIDLQYRKKGRG